MGVKGLRGYMCRKGLTPVIQEKFNILEEIKQWKIHKGNNERPKILIDLKEFIHVVVQRDNLGQLLGGKYGLWMNYFRKFLKQLKEAHVDLIFFASGKKLTDELMIFIPKREEEYIRYLDVLDSIDGSDGSVNEFFKRKDRDIRGPITLEYNMQRLASELGVLHINYVRHNQEMAKFIKQHDKSVLAVITNDNDFMIFDGKYQFWQANDVNLRELTGIRMCRKLLRARLEMNSQQLQLLSALSGSNYLPMLVLRKFYKRIWGEGVEGNRIPQIAKYIRDEVPLISVSGENCVRFDLKKVARDVFGEDYTEQDLNAIENGLAQYNLNFPSDDAEEGISHAMKSCKSRSMFIYKLCTDDVYLVKDICYIDYRNYKSKTYAELIIPLIRKMQGIVFANEPHRPPVRAICMKYAHDEPYKVVEETVDYPPMDVPDLFVLVFNQNNKHHDNARWSLFDWIFDVGLDFIRTLKKTHKKYFAVLVTIKYLLQQEEITIEEADAILITEHFVRNYRPNQVRDHRVEQLNTHFIRVAHLYAKMYSLICHCLEVCGLSYYTDFIMFDGQHFHCVLQSFSLNADKKNEALKKIHEIRIYTK